MAWDVVVILLVPEKYYRTSIDRNITISNCKEKTTRVDFYRRVEEEFKKKFPFEKFNEWKLYRKRHEYKFVCKGVMEEYSMHRVLYLINTKMEYTDRDQ
jgi:hypothetical protein